MRERKYVKFRVDMLSDTKAKIIDRKSERDLIHYVWMALVLLAGKVNLCGELYLSKNIPYTIETLAIELNRDVDQIRLALDILIELDMMELAEDNIYRVKNFVKHQNIKVKEKSEAKEAAKQVNQNSTDEVFDNKSDETGDKTSEVEKEKLDGNIIKIESSNNVINSIERTKGYIDNKNIMDNQQEKPPIILETQKNRKTNKGKNKDKSNKNIKNKSLNITDEEIEEEPLLVFSNGERTLMEGEEAIAQWSF